MDTTARIAKIDERDVTLYAEVLEAVKKQDGGSALALTIERGSGDGRETFTAQVAPMPLPQPEYGLDFREATYIYKASSPLDAVKVGMASSWKLVQESWLTLKRIMLGSVSGSIPGKALAYMRVRVGPGPNRLARTDVVAHSAPWRHLELNQVICNLLEAAE